MLLVRLTYASFVGDGHNLGMLTIGDISHF
jgi:hypothetical protein